MSLSRREFLQVLSLASIGGLSFSAHDAKAARAAAAMYEVPSFGNVHLLHLTDSHAQLQPLYFREPSVNLGIGADWGKVPHLTGENFLHHFALPTKSAEAYAFTAIDFVPAAHKYGKVGGFAHLATLLRQLRTSRPNALLLDGGDSWQGSGSSLWSKGQDMVEMAKALGVDAMTLHWEVTFGEDRVREIADKDFNGRVEILAQNIATSDFADPVFPAYALREMNGVPIAIIGQAYPYAPIAHPRWLMPNWTFGIQEANLQTVVDKVRSLGVQAVVLLSHNGMDVDLKLASRVRGIDVILGGHTHDAIPIPQIVSNPAGQTLVTNAGANGKFLAVLDLQVNNGGVRDFRYRLLPIFSNFLPPDPQVEELIKQLRAPYLPILREKLAVTNGLLYRRGTFTGTFDQLILDALIAVQGADIAFSPGFRWGPTLLPGGTLYMEDLLAQTAITYPWVTLQDMTSATIKTILEDVADNLFNPDPYYRQGGDMVRVGGLQYTCNPTAPAGLRISNMRLKGKPIDATKNYKVAGWAPVAEDKKNSGPPVWDVVARYLHNHPSGFLPALTPNIPHLKSMARNPGLS